MVRAIFSLGLLVLIVSCRESEQTSAFTGNETTYSLAQASAYKVTGAVTFKERKDGATTVEVNLKGTEGEIRYPVHLHLGDIATPSADVAALINPVYGKTGKSETILSQLADESTITYASLVKLNACIKVHLSDRGAERDIILAAGNIGIAATNSLTNGRVGIAPCKSK